MDFQKAKEIFEKLYQNVDGYQIAFEAKSELGLDDQSLTYGEIIFDTFYQMLLKVHPTKEDVFYDLGSGTGKPVVAGSLLFNFRKSVGIEILGKLHQASLDVRRRYFEILANELPQRQVGIIDFVHGDFFEVDFSEADIVFANSTCFDQNLMKKLEDKLSSLKSGSRILTLTNRLTRQEFKLIDSGFFRQGWGEATVYFYQRI